MSSVSFPHSDHISSVSSSSVHDGQYYPPPFDTNSFHMNPLSSHPPRTPRTSIISTGSHTYNSSIFDGKEDEQAQVVVVDNDDEDDKDLEEEAESRVRKEAVWREIFLTSNGRDKAFVRLSDISGFSQN
jgi:hypothetical protein